MSREGTCAEDGQGDTETSCAINATRAALKNGHLLPILSENKRFLMEMVGDWGMAEMRQAGTR